MGRGRGNKKKRGREGRRKGGEFKPPGRRRQFRPEVMLGRSISERI